VTANKKVFHVHLREDGCEILFWNSGNLDRFGVILDDHFAFVEQVTFEDVSVVTLMNFAGLGIS
jgi:hypothetical protein